MKYLLIDGNSIGFAAQNSSKLTVGGTEVQAVFGFMRSMRLLMSKYGATHRPIVLWDGATWRKSEYAEYKGKRNANEKMRIMRDSYKLQRPLISKFLRALAVTQMIAANLEADDLAGMVHGKVSSDDSIVLISGYQDWLQLINDRTVWVDPIRDHRVTVGNFTEFTGYADGRAFLQGKALMGDTSDNIPGVGGIGKTAAPILLQEYGSVEAFFKVSREEGFELPASLKRYTKKLLAFSQPDSDSHLAFTSNMRLMDLSDFNVIPKPVSKNILTGEYSKEKFGDLCESLSFLSILSDLDKWLIPFKRA
jgi:DNA polymerase I